MLLALHNEEDTVTTGWVEQLGAGAVFAELMLDHRFSICNSRKRLIDLPDAHPVGEPIINECLEKLSAAKLENHLLRG